MHDQLYHAVVNILYLHSLQTSFGILLPLLTPSILHSFYPLHLLYILPIIKEGSIHRGLQAPQKEVKQNPHGSELGTVSS